MAFRRTSGRCPAINRTAVSVSPRSLVFQYVGGKFIPKHTEGTEIVVTNEGKANLKLSRITHGKVTHFKIQRYM